MSGPPTPLTRPGFERYIASKLPRPIRKWVVYLAAIQALEGTQPISSVTAGQMLHSLDL